MNPRRCMFAVATLALSLTACVTGMPMSMYGVAPAGTDEALDCATSQLNYLGYTIEAGDSKMGFVRAGRHLPTERRWLLPGSDERDILTAAVFEDPATGAASLRVTAAVKSHDDVGAPTNRGTADAVTIMDECSDDFGVEIGGADS